MNPTQKQLQVEVDTAFLYRSIAQRQQDDNLKNILLSLQEIELGHARRMLEKLRKEEPGPSWKMPRESRRARVQLWLGKYFG